MLKVPLGATDETLYLSMLEASAKYFRIPKYQIYTEDELAALVHMKYEKMKGEPDTGIYPYIGRNQGGEEHEFKRKKLFNIERFHAG